MVLLILLAAESLDLDSFLNKFHENNMDTTMWYELGLEIGVPSEFLEQLKGYPDNQCLIEVADYWLRNHPDKPTWSEIESILYEFLPTAVNVNNMAKPGYNVPGI